MAARRTPQEARDRLRKLFEAELDRMVPLNPGMPKKGRTFRDFEMQAAKFKEAVIPAMLEELAGLDQAAQVATAGRCPHCGEERTYLKKQATQKEARSPDGVVVLETQQARCRACGGSFSPSGA